MPLPSVTPELLAAAVAAADAGVLVCDRGLPDTPIVFANDAFCGITGYARDEVLGRNCRFLQGAGTDRAAVARLRAALETGRPAEAELLNYRRDGTPFWNALRITPVADGTARPRFLVGVEHDVTGRVEAERGLRRHAALLAQTGRMTGIGGWALDLATMTTDWSDEVYRVHGLEPAQPLALAGALDFYPPEARAALARALARAAAEGEPFDLELPFVDAGGGRRRVRATGEAEREGGRVVRLFGTFQDVTERRAAEAARRASERRFRSLVENMRGIVFCHGVAGDGPDGYDGDGARVYGADAARLAGTVDERGRARIGTWYDAVHPEDRPAYLAAERGRKERGEPYALEYRIAHPATGEERWMREVAWAVVDPGAGRTHLDSYILDVTEQKHAEARIRHLAHHDPLTGLPNRTLFQDRLRQALAQAHRHGERVGLLLLDLDRFKDVNDTLGHDAGDALLREVARRLPGCVREGDTVARLGGDEFAVVLPRVAGPGDAAGIARGIAAALAEPAAHGGALVHTGASIGVTVFPDDGEEAAQLLKNADIALYKAKAEGGGGHCFFVADMRVRVERRRGIEGELRLALARGGEIVPFYQPVVRLRDGRAAGFEALARWRHPARGVLLPDEFLPVAEEAGLIAPLGEAVLRQAVAHAAAWQRGRLAAGRVAVNVAGAQLRRGGLAATVREALAEAGLSPRRLSIEVTEGVFLGRGADRVAEELEALHALGVGVALDDFGTGYASLTHVKRFPVGALKIDASFVRDVLADPDDAAIVRAVIGLGHGLGTRVVAEGVETAGQADWLRIQGCDYGQGFLYGRAMPAAAVPGWLQRHGRGATVGAAAG